MTLAPLLLGAFGTLAVLLVLGSLSATVWLAYRQSPKARRRPQEEVEEPQWASRVAALEVKVDALPGLWEEERRRAEQARDRERYYASKSRRKRAQDDEGDGEADELPGDDAGGSAAQGMLPLPTDLGNHPRSLEPEHIARARTMGYPWTFVS